MSEIPFAMLVIHEIPAIYIPMWFATIASCTVDIPEQSHPILKAICASASVWKLGPLKSA